jgi:hypothetical protein
MYTIRQFGFEKLDDEHFYHIFFHTVVKTSSQKTCLVVKSGRFEENRMIFIFFFFFQVSMTTFGPKISAVGVRHPAFQT